MLIKLGCCPDCGAEVGQVHFDHCKLELCSARPWRNWWTGWLPTPDGKPKNYDLPSMEVFVSMPELASFLIQQKWHSQYEKEHCQKILEKIGYGVFDENQYAFKVGGVQSNGARMYDMVVSIPDGTKQARCSG